MAEGASKKLLKMGDLIERTGVQRQTIHFYINKGLLPRPIKTSRNMAYYEESYVERIKLIKELQAKKFLPLDVIKQILAQADGDLSPSEIDVIKLSREGLFEIEELRREYEPQTLSELSDHTGLPPEEIEEMELYEMISSVAPNEQGDKADERGEKIYGDRDIRIVEAFSQMRKGGLTKERGFDVELFRLHVDFINILATEEVKIFGRNFAEHFSKDSSKLLPQIAENAVETINQFISCLRRKKVFDAVDALSGAGDGGPNKK
jgi:DNA-binding transcriptional MerR regulator